MTHARVKALLKLPRIEQKSEAWYEMRRNMITASDFAQALGEGKFGTQKQLIEKKCLPRENETVISKSNPFFKWGHTYEPVACDVYKRMHNVIIHEFGLIQHPKYEFLGASPDGITDDGVMLEIKCPMKRKLTGDVPTQYYYQVQGQLDVCRLEECDYFECTFEQLPFEEWSNVTDKIKGVFEDGEEIKYQPPFFPGDDTSDAWQGEGNYKYWVLRNYNLQRITKDPVFVKQKIKELKKVWDKITYYRENPKAFDIEVRNAIDIDTEISSLSLSSSPPKKAKGKGKTFEEMLNTDKYLFLD